MAAMWLLRIRRSGFRVWFILLCMLCTLCLFDLVRGGIQLGFDVVTALPAFAALSCSDSEALAKFWQVAFSFYCTYALDYKVNMSPLGSNLQWYKDNTMDTKSISWVSLCQSRETQ